MHAEVILCLALAAISAAQVYYPASLPVAIQPPPIQQTFGFHQQPLIYQQAATRAAPARRELAHRAVVVNAQQEAQLPSHLLNPFYKNPRIAEALAKESWFGPGEMHVTDREAEKIPRERIFSVLKNAGLARRR